MFSLTASYNKDLTQVQHYLRFDVSVENSVPMHVLNRFQELVNVRLNFLLWQVTLFSFDRFVQIHLHNLKH